MFTVAFDLKVLLLLLDPTVALLLRRRLIVVGLPDALFWLDSVFIEPIHLPARHRVDVHDDVRLATIKRVRFAGVVAPLHVIPCVVADGSARRASSVSTASEAVMMR
eukprot:712409-Pleurochrysis_carterae.AAC.1